MKKYLLLVFTTVFLFSCSNDDLDPINSSSQEDVLSFTYNGIEYSSAYKMLEDSTIIFEDERVDEIYNSFINEVNLATYIDDSGNLYFFKSEEELDNYLQTKIKTKVAFVSVPLPHLRLHFYSGENYTGTKAPFLYSVPILLGIDKKDIYNYYKNDYRLEVSDLRIWNFNDLLTSFRITDEGSRLSSNGNFGSYNLRLYQNVGFKGKSITFTGRDMVCPSLASYGFMNKASAFRIYSRDY